MPCSTGAVNRSPRDEERAFAMRAQADLLDLVRHRDVFGACARAVGGHGDRYGAILIRVHVVHVQFAAEFVDDVAVAIAARPAHVEVAVLGELRGLCAADVVLVQIQHVVAIGHEINRVADPHRIAVRARIVGDVAALLRGDVENVCKIFPAQPP